MVVETEPFDSNKNGEEEKEGVVEICVPDWWHTQQIGRSGCRREGCRGALCGTGYWRPGGDRRRVRDAC